VAPSPPPSGLVQDVFFVRDLCRLFPPDDHYRPSQSFESDPQEMVFISSISARASGTLFEPGQKPTLSPVGVPPARTRVIHLLRTLTLSGDVSASFTPQFGPPTREIWVCGRPPVRAPRLALLFERSFLRPSDLLRFRRLLSCDLPVLLLWLRGY